MESNERIVNVEDRPDLSSSLRQNGRSNRRNRTLTVSFREPQPIPISKSQYVTLILMSFVNFTSNVSFTILASFFDENASQHGLGKSQTGLIVAIYAGIAMIMSPIFGIYLEKLVKNFFSFLVSLLPPPVPVYFHCLIELLILIFILRLGLF